MKHAVPKPGIELHVHGPGIAIEGEFTHWTAVLVHRQDDSNLVTVGLVLSAAAGRDELDGSIDERVSVPEPLFGFSSSRIQRIADTALLATGLFSSERNEPQPLRLALELRQQADVDETLAISFATPLQEHSPRWWQLLVADNPLAALQLFPPGGRLN